MGTLLRITFNYTELHRGGTELHRVKNNDLCGPLCNLSVALCKFLKSYFSRHTKFH